MVLPFDCHVDVAKTQKKAQAEACALGSIPQFYFDGALSAVDGLHAHVQEVRRVGRVSLASRPEDLAFLVGQYIKSCRWDFACSIKLKPVTAYTHRPLTDVPDRWGC